MDLAKTCETSDRDTGESVYLSPEQAAIRLATVWGLHATATGLMALFDRGCGPRARWMWLFSDGKLGWRIESRELDKWAAYQLNRDRRRYDVVKSTPETDRQQPCYLLVGISDVTHPTDEALMASGWRVLWANDYLEALELAATHRIDAATFVAEQHSMELAILLFESLTERGAACVIPKPDSVGVIPAFAGAKMFGWVTEFEDAVNSLPVVGTAPFQLKVYEEPDEARRDAPDDDSIMKWLQELAESDK